MPSFSASSKRHLATCHKDLQRIANEAIKFVDFTVLEGFRDEEAQNRAYARGLSKVQWPYGKHNKKPSLAFDVAPYPIDWKNEEKATQRFVMLAGYFLRIADEMGIRLRWGGDWNMNFDTRDEQFRDMGHFEVLNP